MATALIVPVAEPGGTGSMRILVEEDFDTCFNRVVPLQPPTSQLEARGNMLYSKADGTGRIMVQPQAVAMMEENADDH